MINAGRMRHIIRIEKQVTTQDAAGQPVLTWTLVTLKRASIEKSRFGSELWNQTQRLGRVPVTFKLRWVAGIKPSMRLLFDGRLFDIVAVVDIEGQHNGLLLTTDELVEETT